MRRFAFVVLGLVVVLALAVGSLWVYAPPAVMTALLARGVQMETGRTLKVAGPAQYKFGSTLKVHLEKVSLSGPPGAPDLLNADALDAEIALKPLLQRRVEILNSNVTRPAVTITPGDPLLDAKSGGNSALVLHALGVSDGTLAVKSDGKSKAWDIDQVSASLDQDPATGAGTLKGSLRRGGEPMTFTAKIANLGALQRRAVSQADITIEGKPVSGTFKGEIDPGGNPYVAGDLSAKTGSLGDLLRWLGVSTTATGSGAAALDGRLTASAALVKFEQGKLSLPAGEGAVTGELKLDGPKPALQARVTATRIDLDALLGTSAPTAAATAAPDGPVIPSAWASLVSDLTNLPAGPPPPPSPEAALAAAPQASRSAWSSEPLGLDRLTEMDVDVGLKAAEIRYAALPLRNGDVAIAVRDGRMTVDLKSLEVDKGKASGKIDIDATAKPAKSAVGLKLDSVAAGPLAQALTGQKLLSGTGGADINVTASGGSERDLVNSLSGQIKFALQKGYIAGFNLRQAVLEWWQPRKFDPSQQTQFERLNAGYTVKNGVLNTTTDVLLAGPEVQVTSSGFLSLPARTLDQAVRLTLVPPPVSLPVPLRVTGPWSKPDVAWDWKSVLWNPTGFSAAPVVAGGGQTVPPEVRQAIEKALAEDSGKLPPETRAMLQSLIGVLPATPTAPGAGEKKE